MKKLKNVARGFISLVDHWEKWHLTGLHFLWKRISRPNKEIKVKLKELEKPVFLRNNTSDITVFYQVFFLNSYNFNYPSQVDVIIDCGANIGMSSIFFHLRFPQALILALEPEESNYNMLVKNCSYYQNIITLKAGIWNKNTKLQLVNKSNEPWEMQVEENQNDSIKDVEAVSISYLLQKFNLPKIDILKIDIEGSEKELFEFDSEKWLPHTRIICIELHDHMRKGAAQSFFRAIDKYEYTMVKRKENLFFYFNH